MNYLSMINDSIDYIESNLGADIRLETLAQRYHLSPTHFYRMFRAVTNRTLKQYIGERRLTEAARAIRKTKRSLLDIALEHGFQSHESFTRSFRRVYGMNPNEYRRNPVALPDLERIMIVEREFKNANRDIIVNYECMELSEMTLWSKTFHFQSEDEKQLGDVGQFVQDFIRDYVAEGRANRLYSLTRSDCLNTGMIWYSPAIDIKVDHPDMNPVHIPASAYAVFTYKGSMGNIFRTVTRDLYTCISVTNLRLNSQVSIDFFECYEEDFEQTGIFRIFVPIQ